MSPSDVKAERKAERAFQHGNSTSYLTAYGSVKLKGNCGNVISSKHFTPFLAFFFLISATEVKTLGNVALETARRKWMSVSQHLKPDSSFKYPLCCARTALGPPVTLPATNTSCAEASASGKRWMQPAVIFAALIIPSC